MFIMETVRRIFSITMKKYYIYLSSISLLPGSGANNEKGKHNNILNIPLPAGTNSEEYLNAYEYVLKKLKQFKPEFVLFSAVLMLIKMIH